MILKILHNFAIYSALVPCSFLILYFKKLNKAYLLFFFLIVYSFVSDMVADYLSHKQQNSLWLTNLFFLVEGLGFINILKQFLKSASKFSLAFFASIIFCVVWCGNWLYAASILQIFDIANCAEGIIVMLLAGAALLHIADSSESAIFKNGNFWFSFALLLYFSIATTVFSVVNIDNHNQLKLFIKISFIHQIALILSNAIFTIAIWLNFRKTN